MNKSRFFIYFISDLKTINFNREVSINIYTGRCQHVVFVKKTYDREGFITLILINTFKHTRI